MPTQLHGVGRQALLLEAQDIEVQPGREGESLAIFGCIAGRRGLSRSRRYRSCS